MSPCGTHSLSECAIARTSPLAIITSMPPFCVGISCLSPCRLPVGRRVIFLLGGMCRRPGCSSAPSSLRPGAAEWLRLAQKIPFLRGKWSVHNPGQ